AASKPGEKKDTPPTLDKIKADLKDAEPSLTDADIAELLFWYSLGFDQLSFEVFEVIYLQEELAYYGVPAEEITFITEHFEDKAAVDEAIGKLSVADDIRQKMLDNYEAKLEELGPQACGCAAAQAMLLTAKG